jgi:hypothetical protein
VEFTRGLGNMLWHTREFAVKDCDGRLLARSLRSGEAHGAHNPRRRPRKSAPRRAAMTVSRDKKLYFLLFLSGRLSF